MQKQIAVYGSLKRGFGNHSMIKSAPLMGTDKVRGYMTLVFKSYPQLYLDDNEREHEVEIYQVNEDQYRSVRAMELGAGYVEKEIELSVGKCYIYVFDSKSRMYGEPIDAYTREVLI